MTAASTARLATASGSSSPSEMPARTAMAVRAGTAAIWIGLLAIALAGGGGRDLYFYATGAVGGSIALSILVGQRFPNLLMAFQVGFVVIIAVEGIFRGDELVQEFGSDRFGMVSRYVVAGLSIVALSHLVTQQAGTARARPSRRAAPAIAVDSHRSAAAILLASTAYFVGISTRVWARVSSGRVVAFEPWFAGTALEPLVTGTINACGMLLPAAIMFHFVRLRRTRPSVAALFCIPFLLVQFAIGTRFPLLFAIAGMVVVATANVRLRPGVVLRTLVIGSLVFVMSSAMTQFRSVGLSNAGADALTISTDRIAEGERTIQNLCEITAWFDDEGYESGLSSLTVTFFFVPRSFWPEKPEAMGYWFPRRYGNAGFSEGHSIAYSFVGDPYADFGFGGGLLALIPLGIALGLLDRWCAARLARPSDPRIVIAAPLYGAAFFAARSVDTAIIAMCFLFAIGMVYVRLIRRRRPAAADHEP